MVSHMQEESEPHVISAQQVFASLFHFHPEEDEHLVETSAKFLSEI